MSANLAVRGVGRRWARASLLTAVLVTLLVALPSMPVFSPAYAGEPVTVQLNWKHQFEFAAFYAALERGYYRDAGLDVTLREGGPGIDVTREVLAGRAQYGVGGSTLVVERYRGAPVVAMAALMQHSPIALLGRRTKGLESVHDLADKPVAVDPHNRDEIDAYLRAVGIPPTRIRLVEQTAWGLSTIHSGQAAAEVVYLSNEPFLIRDRQEQYLLMTPRSAGIDLFGNILFCAESTAVTRKASVHAFRNATLKGLAYALNHPEELADLILARYNSQEKSREHLLYEAARIAELTRHDIVEPGYMSSNRWRHVVEVYAHEGKMPADFDLSGFVLDEAPAVVPPWVLWSLAGALAALVVAMAIAAKLRQLNLELARQVEQRAQAQAALVENEARANLILDMAPEAMLVANARGRIVRANRCAEEVFGYTAGELLALGIEDLVPRWVRERHTALRDGYMTAPQVRPMGSLRELRGLRRDGTEFRANVSLAPLVIGGAQHVIVAVVDITARVESERRAQEADQRLRLAIESLDEFFVLYDPSDRIVLTNQRFRDLNRAVAETTAIGAHFEDHLRALLAHGLVPQAAGRESAWLQARMAAHRDPGAPVEIEREAGQWYLIRETRLADGSTFTVGLDVSDIHRAEREIRELNVSLERRVAERTAELKAANERLESFAYSVSHDLRGPLRAIAGFSEILAEDLGQRLSAEERSLLDRVITGVRRMNALIDDLLEFSRVGRASMMTAVLPLRAMAAEVAEELRSINPRAEVRIADLPDAQGDRAMVRQVLLNLIGNALKFSSKVPAPRVDIDFETVNGEVVYLVRDNGAGFDLRYATKLFGVFQRLHKAEQFEGTGVGLAIVDQVIKRHGGRIWADAAPDQGATFRFTLGAPAASASSTVSAP